MKKIAKLALKNSRKPEIARVKKKTNKRLTSVKINKKSSKPIMLDSKKDANYKIRLIGEIYAHIILYYSSASFEKSNIGADLAYLIGAIAKDQICIWGGNKALVQLLGEKFPNDHEIWNYIGIA